MRDRTEDQMTLVLIRHGETQANRERRYLGKTDESLSESGIEALLSYKRKKIYPEVQYLFTSPMKRCLETARILYPGLCPVVIPEWEEMDFGRFEYGNYEELKNDMQYQAWIDSGGTLDFPEGESREHFILRCERGLERMCGELRRAAGASLTYSGQEAVRSVPEPDRGTVRSVPELDRGTVRSVPEPDRGTVRSVPGFGREAVRCVPEPVRVGAVVHGGTIMALLCARGGKGYFDSQVLNGGGYVCKMTGWGDSIRIEEEVRL